MKDWIPFFNVLVWPIFWALVLVCGWRPLRRLLKACEERIASGAEFEAGAKGIRIGAAPKLTEVMSSVAAPTVPPKAEPPGVPTPRDIYLVHTARRDRRLDQGDRQYFRVRIYLDADDQQRLDWVSQVTYRLHDTVNHSVRTVTDRRSAFEVRTVLWGEFNVAAVVHFKDGHEVTLERYLNL